jgi:DNA gyrase subunit A
MSRKKKDTAAPGSDRDRIFDNPGGGDSGGGEQIISTEYSELMQKAYIDYAMSVIVSRALPDVRDGLKPVQRRTLYDMYELGIRSDRPYRKSARIVGDTMGKYHPHGDSSIYDALVVMAQEFKKGLPLIDGHGNFGNIEGDGAAAMRYTEARLEKITEEAFLADLDKDVADFGPNFDETEKEPVVLPVRIPNFLVNGSEGIAVGMATSTPPHNLAEVIDAELALLDNPEITTEALMRILPGPDFPTGGIIINRDDLLQIYETGQGKIRIRGRVEIEKGKSGHINLVITEIPYTMVGAGIGKFLSDVASLAENKVTNDVIDITNQSSKEGIRIVIELRKDTDVENFKNLLYKKTRLEDTFGVNMLGILDGRPETMGLRAVLEASADFQYEIAGRKYTTLLEKEQKKREIQEGLIQACNVIDLIIEILRGSRDRAMAKRCLVSGETEGIRFRSDMSREMASQLHFTEVQADAILDMRLYRLIGLEIEALMKEHEETVANIYKYEDILENRSAMTKVIRAELLSFKKKYGQPRKTEIIQGKEAVYAAPAEDTDRELFFVMDRFGYAKTMEPGIFSRNEAAVRENSRFCFPCRSGGRICLFTREGQLYTLKTADLPAGKMRDKGVPVDNVSNYDSAREEIVYAASQEALRLDKVVFVTGSGMVKAVPGTEFDVIKKTVAATKLTPDDRVVFVSGLGDALSLVLQTRGGMFLRFAVEDIPEQKKNAIGSRGIRLSGDDTVENAWLLSQGDKTVIKVHDTEIDITRLRISKRDGKGTKRF